MIVWSTTLSWGLLSTGNCKISDFSEKDNLRRFKIELFSRSAVNLILDFAYELVGQGCKILPDWGEAVGL